MSIWFSEFTANFLNQRGKNTIVEFLGIEFTTIGTDSLTAIMPVTERTKQPLGIIHGGANVVLAETLASTAANAVLDPDQYYCVGLEINANHIRQVSHGFVTGVTRPVHIGKMTQIWHIDIYNESGKQTCISRMTACVLKKF